MLGLRVHTCLLKRIHFILDYFLHIRTSYLLKKIYFMFLQQYIRIKDFISMDLAACEGCV